MRRREHRSPAVSAGLAGRRGHGAGHDRHHPAARPFRRRAILAATRRRLRADRRHRRVRQRHHHRASPSSPRPRWRRRPIGSRPAVRHRAWRPRHRRVRLAPAPWSPGKRDAERPRRLCAAAILASPPGCAGLTPGHACSDERPWCAASGAVALPSSRRPAATDSARGHGRRTARRARWPSTCRASGSR